MTLRELLCCLLGIVFFSFSFRASERTTECQFIVTEGKKSHFFQMIQSSELDYRYSLSILL